MNCCRQKSFAEEVFRNERNIDILYTRTPEIWRVCLLAVRQEKIISERTSHPESRMNWHIHQIHRIVL